MCIYHILIHSSVDGHLSCLHVLTIANSVAMNMRAHVSFSFLSFFFLLHYFFMWFYLFFLFFIFPLYSKGIKLSLHVYTTFFPPPFVLFQHEYLDIVLNATQQHLLVNLF